MGGFELVQVIFWSLVFSAGFALVNGVKGRTVFFCALGGAIAWAAYKCFGLIVSDILAVFLATICFATYSEIMARLLKKPATIFLIVALLPLVPGAAIYYSMVELVAGHNEEAGRFAINAFSTAGVIALGIMMVSSVARIIKQLKEKRRGAWSRP